MLRTFIYGEDFTHNSVGPGESMPLQHRRSHEGDSGPEKTPSDPKFVERVYQPYELIFKEGEVGDGMYILHSGEVVIFQTYQGAQGPEEMILANVADWGVFGEMSLFDYQVRSASVRAVTECKIAFIPAGMLELQLDQQPIWVMTLIRILTNRLRATNSKLKKIMDSYNQVLELVERKGKEETAHNDETGINLGEAVNEVHQKMIKNELTPEEEIIQKAMKEEALSFCKNIKK